jgi:hypothetical protein
MRAMKQRIAAGAAVCLILAGSAPAVEAQADTTELRRLRQQMDALTREIEALRLGQDVLPQADSSLYGLGPAAAKVYRVRQGVSLGGYGEFLYQNYAKEREDGAAATQRDRADALRAILYVGYKFTDRLLFNSEIEVEHGSTDRGGSVSVEFAYIDYLHAPSFGVRGGMLLVPMGFVNELHEPPIFIGSTRPLTENAIIPTTWRENGFGVFGGLGDFDYRVYVVNGLDAIGGGFAAGGLRGGRQKGAQALAEDPAIVARLDYAPHGLLPGLTLGGSAYRGNSGQNAEVDGQDIDATTTIVEGHGEYRAHGLELRGLFATATVDDVELINQARGLSGSGSVGERLRGWYAHAGYDVLRTMETQHELTPYVRYEQVNTQVRVPAGYQSSGATDRTITTIGAQWKPLLNIVLKADYQIHSNQAETGVNQFNVVLGYLF